MPWKAYGFKCINRKGGFETSLRAKRSNPAGLPGVAAQLDCFVATLLAMTRLPLRPQPLHLQLGQKRHQRVRAHFHDGRHIELDQRFALVGR
jgi:hypothetical protein